MRAEILSTAPCVVKSWFGFLTEIWELMSQTVENISI